jgi:hypothetical protein
MGRFDRFRADADYSHSSSSIRIGADSYSG